MWWMSECNIQVILLVQADLGVTLRPHRLLHPMVCSKDLIRAKAIAGQLCPLLYGVCLRRLLALREPLDVVQPV